MTQTKFCGMADSALAGLLTTLPPKFKGRRWSGACYGGNPAVMLVLLWRAYGYAHSQIDWKGVRSAFDYANEQRDLAAP